MELFHRTPEVYLENPGLLSSNDMKYMMTFMCPILIPQLDTGRLGNGAPLQQESAFCLHCLVEVNVCIRSLLFQEVFSDDSKVDSEHCFDLLGLISAFGATDIYSRQYNTREGSFCLRFVTTPVTRTCKKTLCPTRSPVKNRGTRQALCLCIQPRKHSECQR